MKKAIFKLIQRKSRQKIDGTFPIYIYFKERGASRENLLSTNFSCNINEWSQKEQAFRDSMKDSYPMNKSLNTLKTACMAVIEKYYTDNRNLTFEKFKKELEFKDQPSNNVIDYIDIVIDRKKDVIKPQSIRSYTQLKLKLEQMYPKHDLYFYEIDRTFLMRFDKYCRQHKNNSNTVCRKHKTLQVVINDALDDELIKVDPYRNFNKGSIRGNRNPLNEFELKKLFEIYRQQTLTRPQQNALRMFLFMCMTGMRISDLLNLKHENIITDFDDAGKEIKMLEFVQQKTNKTSIIPLMPEAMEILSNLPAAPAEPTGYIFKEYRNGQNINYRLKEIASKLSINKNITNHVARHTFATLAIDNEISIYTVRNLLGQTEVKTTEIYSHQGTRSKIRAMQKFSGIFNA